MIRNSDSGILGSSGDADHPDGIPRSSPGLRGAMDASHLRRYVAQQMVATVPPAWQAVLWPVALAATVLLTMHDHPPLRQCASDECSWLYLDTTRNHSRGWCDMKGCGNKAKVRRYRKRQA